MKKLLLAIPVLLLAVMEKFTTMLLAGNSKKQYTKKWMAAHMNAMMACQRKQRI
ncbi:hypothetical protein SFC66_00880 [Terribacillus saccharophilus]|uniref:hypothetical protein n=1 Tax=Terribacillus saccharophilus TaxID=361277 RepID=UPI003981AC9E